MSHHHEVTFNNEVVQLDGNSFTHCRFEGCKMVFNGSDLPPTLSHCVFNRSYFAFEGAASNTIEFMRAIYFGCGEGGKKIIEDTFDKIRVPPA